jgi:hypothetical protein
MARGVAFTTAGAFAVLLTLAGLAALGLVFACVVYLTLTSLFADRR